MAAGHLIVHTGFRLPSHFLDIIAPAPNMLDDYRRGNYSNLPRTRMFWRPRFRRVSQISICNSSGMYHSLEMIAGLRCAATLTEDNTAPWHSKSTNFLLCPGQLFKSSDQSISIWHLGLIHTFPPVKCRIITDVWCCANVHSLSFIAPAWQA